MNGASVVLTFAPDPRTVAVPRGTTILQAARQAGVEIPSDCGARGRCHACRVHIAADPIPPETLQDRVQLGEQAVRNGYRLACQAEAWHDLSIVVPPHVEDHVGRILTETRGLHPEVSDSGIDKRLEDGDTDSVFNGHKIGLDPGDTRTEVFGMAFDVGTTTVVGYLVDLSSSTVAATVSALNPQAGVGTDLISRIAFAGQHPANVRGLQTKIIDCLNGLLREACAHAGIVPDRVCKLVVVGNTVMHHLLLGIDPAPLGRIPFSPVIRGSMQVAAGEAGLAVPASVPLCLLPVVAGFVGADAVGMVLSTRIDESAEPRLAVDIGTNGEAVVGSPAGMMACSAPAGPALEGGQISCGMRATRGAIDRVSLNGDLHVHTIGEAVPRGICGSGILDATAHLLDAGIVESSGRLRLDPPASLPAVLRRRLVVGIDGQGAVVLARKSETGGDHDIALTQADIRQVQLAKAALCSSIQLLLEAAGVDRDQVVELMLAGALGNYLDTCSAVRIGLLPAMPRTRITYIGNAAGLGAQLALVSETERRRADDVAARIKHVSLAADPNFQDVFVNAVRFPDKEEILT
jgi:uncharacterized 2Fe-2S/4Fe-4S cluster protein (DUF4445 family)